MILLIAAAIFVGGPPGPDGLPTVPGVQNTAVTAANIHSTICVPGWSKTQRPPTSYTNKIKFALMAKAGIPRSQTRLYELDHMWSIEAGGSPTDPNNLWLEPYTGPLNAHLKDHVENVVHREICSGRITLPQAGEKLRNWVATYRAEIGPMP
jgi:hypothetical protein